MERDFLGLISKHSTEYRMDKQNFKDPFSDSDNGGDDISLSLSSTSYTPDYQRQILDSPQKKTWKFPFDKMIHACSSSSNSILAYYNQENALTMEQPLAPTPLIHHPLTTNGFLYDLNKKSANLRNNSELPDQQVPLTILYSVSSYVSNDTLPEKANNTMFKAGTAFTKPSSDARKCTRAGYTPTVAMARKATLARFLEKRSHRLDQARTFHIMGKSLNATNSESRNISINRCDKKNSRMRP